MLSVSIRIPLIRLNAHKYRQHKNLVHSQTAVDAINLQNYRKFPKLQKFAINIYLQRKKQNERFRNGNPVSSPADGAWPVEYFQHFLFYQLFAFPFMG